MAPNLTAGNTVTTPSPSR